MDPQCRPPRPRFRKLASTRLLVLLLAVSGCHRWVPAELGPSNEFLNGRARLHGADGTTRLVEGPRIVGDSIVGRAPNSSASITTARADVQRIEVQRIDRGRTAIVGSGLLVLYWVATFAFSDSPQ
jgi:hypothetical protein